eukprot:scaffold47010_cov62-Phaeocystis_antarctica.AAC.1
MEATEMARTTLGRTTIGNLRGITSRLGKWKCQEARPLLWNLTVWCRVIRAARARARETRRAQKPRHESDELT